MRFRGYSWTAGARKHGVSREQARHVVEHCGLVHVREAVPPARPDEALLFLGDDARQARNSRSRAFFSTTDGSG